jgi:large subunit ribosomal protein L5
MNRIHDLYNKEVIPALRKSFDFKNVMQVPHIEKVVINIGVGEALDNPKALEAAVSDLIIITGQKPVVTKSRKAIAGFRLREGMPIGCKVTLRRQRMYEFFDRLISISLPRVRDFRGVSRTAFDGHGNYSLGLSEQLVFPELNPDKFLRTQGMNVTLVISGTRGDDESRELLRAFGMPFKTEEAQAGKAPALVVSCFGSARARAQSAPALCSSRQGHVAGALSSRRECQTSDLQA